MIGRTCKIRKNKDSCSDELLPLQTWAIHIFFVLKLVLALVAFGSTHQLAAVAEEVLEAFDSAASAGSTASNSTTTAGATDTTGATNSTGATNTTDTTDSTDGLIKEEAVGGGSIGDTSSGSESTTETDLPLERKGQVHWNSDLLINDATALHWLLLALYLLGLLLASAGFFSKIRNAYFKFSTRQQLKGSIKS
mmetsp:Transcript_40671/g.62025  ORF Transcript_40671/g.62025 Transcript_40671/m.62025 type:complete len:194 (-) Transcript_40671:1210-1791(-)